MLRVGYRLDGSLPFAFLNAQGDLVGFDVEMAHSLAQSLGVRLAFVPVKRGLGQQRFAEILTSGGCDIIISTALSMAYVPDLSYSTPYIDLTMAFVVRDHRRREFSEHEAIAKRPDLRLAVLDDCYYLTRFRRLLPNAKLVPLRLVRQFFEERSEEFDALLFAAELGSAWSLLYPMYTVVPQGLSQKVPLAYALPLGEIDWINAVNSWIELKKRDGTMEQPYDYWVLGRTTKRRESRWSVVRNVLHWID